jgi:response regulator of citrate/malate metabolism
VSKEKDIVLLDYATNGNVLDPRKPLSHAFLVKAFVEGNYPTRESLADQKKVTLLPIINFDLLRSTWLSKSEKELSKSSGIRIDYVKKITNILKENKDLDFNELSKKEGIGKATLKKLSDFFIEKKSLKNQITLF